MGKKAKAKKAQNDTVFEVGKRYLIEGGPHGSLEEALIEETTNDISGAQYFSSSEGPFHGHPFWRRSSDFKIIAELPAKAKKEGTE